MNAMHSHADSLTVESVHFAKTPFPELRGVGGGQHYNYRRSSVGMEPINFVYPNTAINNFE